MILIVNVKSLGICYVGALSSYAFLKSCWTIELIKKYKQNIADINYLPRCSYHLLYVLSKATVNQLNFNAHFLFWGLRLTLC